MLVTLRQDLKKVRDLVTKYGKLDSDRIARVDKKPLELAMIFDKKLNFFDIRDAKRNVLQKGSPHAVGL